MITFLYPLRIKCTVFHKLDTKLSRSIYFEWIHEYIYELTHKIMVWVTSSSSLTYLLSLTKQARNRFSGTEIQVASE